MTKSMMILTLLLTLAQSACSTVFFHNGPDASNDVGPDRLHHIVIGGIEIVEPVNLDQECSGRDWETVKTEQTFVSGLIRGLLNPAYTPWGVAWKCKP